MPIKLRGCLGPALLLTGVYEVFAGGEIFRVDSEVDFMFVKGSMIDVAGRTDLGEARMRVFTASNFEQLPLDLAFSVDAEGRIVHTHAGPLSATLVDEALRPLARKLRSIPGRVVGAPSATGAQ